MSGSDNFPSARHSQLVVETLQDEILIYDVERAQASCLNPTAALVWKYADGKTSVADIAKKMSAVLKTSVDVRVVWYALEQLDKKHLLGSKVQAPMPYRQMSRRDFFTKAGIVGVAVAIPVIISLAAPTPAMAATCAPVSCSALSPCPSPCTCRSELPRICI